MKKHRLQGLCFIGLVLLLATSCRDPRVFYPGLGADSPSAGGAVQEQFFSSEPVLLAEAQGLQLLVYALDYSSGQLRARLHNTGPRAVERIWLRFADPNSPVSDTERMFRMLPNRHIKRLKPGASFQFAANLPGPAIAKSSIASLRVVVVPASDFQHHVIARRDWDPHPLHPRGVTRYPKLSGEYLRWIVIHHTAVWNAAGPEFVREIHVDWRGWADIGYHYIIGEDGSIYAGRDMHLMGAHAGQSVEANQGVWRARHPRARLDSSMDRRSRIDQARRFDPDYGSIGISLDGDFRFGIEPTTAQKQALLWLIDSLQNRFHIPDTHIITHREVAQRLVAQRGLHFTGHHTQCPGEYLQRLVDHIRAKKLAKNTLTK